MRPFERKALEMEPEPGILFEALLTGVCLTLDLIDDCICGLRKLKTLVSDYALERLEADNDH